MGEHQTEFSLGSSKVGEPAQSKVMWTTQVHMICQAKIATSSQMVLSCLRSTNLMKTAPVSDFRENEDSKGEVDGEHETRTKIVGCQSLKHAPVLLK